MKRYSRRFVHRMLGSAAVLAALAVQTTAASAAEISFYSGLAREITDKLINDFTSKNPDISVTVFQAPIETLLQKIELEVMSGGSIQADVIWTGDFSVMKSFTERDLLQPYVAQGSENVSAEMKDPDGYWITTIPLTLHIMYNKDRVDEAETPGSWLDLADERWHGRLALSNPANSGTAAILTQALAVQYGWEYWEKIAAGNPLISPSTASIVNAVVSGERDIVPMVDFLVASSLQKNHPVGVVTPEDGVVTTQIIAALTKGASDVEAGKKLIDYLVSLEAAELQAENGYYSSRNDAPPPKGLTPLSELKFMPFDWQRYEEEKAEMKEKFRELVGQ